MPRSVAALLALAMVGTAAAQPVVEPEPPLPPQDSGLRFDISAGYQHVFDTDLDITGTYSINRLGAELKINYPISRDFQIEGNIRTLYDDYRFKGATNLDPLLGSPWDDITTISLDFRVRWWMTTDTALIFGPFINWARESGASWGDAVTGGFFAGVLYRASEKFAIGGGLGFSSMIEDDVLVYPLIFIDWKISDQASLTSATGPLGLAFTGLEFTWAFEGGFEIGAGFRYEFRRFRLDDDGFAPGGVGEDKGLPFWGRLTYDFTEYFGLDFYFGVVAGGRFKVDDMNGNALTREDSNLAPTIALAARFHF